MGARRRNVKSPLSALPRPMKISSRIAPLSSVLLALSATACADDPVGPKGVTPNISGQRANVPGQVVAQPGRRSDNELRELVARAPGFGGFYIDEDGRLTINVTEKSDRSKVAQAVREFVGSRTAVKSPLRAAADLGPVFKPARYDFAELSTALDAIITRRIRNGVSSFDVDERRNRVVIGARDSASVALISAAVRQLANVPDGMVLVESVGQYQPEQMTDIRTLTRPVVGGVQISGPAGYCTLGANVQPATFPNGYSVIDYTYEYFVTAGHCTAIQGSPDYASFGQPTDVYPVGTEVYDPPWASAPLWTSDGNGGEQRYSDAAIVRYNAGVARTFGALARVDANGGFSINGTRRISTEGRTKYSVGAAIQKLGRTTGRTSGTVRESCVVVVVQANPYRTLQCVNIGNYASSGGDSGGPVYSTLADGSVSLEGIHSGSLSSTRKVYSPTYNIYLDFVQSFGTPYYGTYP